MRLRVGGCLLLLCASACDGRSAALVEQTSDAQALRSASFGPSNPMAGARHAGVRLVEFFSPDGSRLAYRERVATDGQGRFSIDYSELVEGKGLDGELFELLQRSSQGFLYRYRDFAIRSTERFDRNYSWVARDESPFVAGRKGRLIEVRGAGPSAGSYRLTLDEETGIVLASEERDGSGRLVHAVTYESFEADPQLEGVEWHRPVNSEQVVDAHAPLEDQLGVPVLEPRLLPSGYAWSEAATVEEGNGRTWLKLTYTDGVRTALFLQALPDAEEKEVSFEAPLLQNQLQSQVSPGSSTGDRVTVYSMGGVTVVQGRVAGVDVIALGRLEEAQLLDLIESALP